MARQDESKRSAGGSRKAGGRKAGGKTASRGAAARRFDPAQGAPSKVEGRKAGSRSAGARGGARKAAAKRPATRKAAAKRPATRKTAAKRPATRKAAGGRGAAKAAGGRGAAKASGGAKRAGAKRSGGAATKGGAAGGRGRLWIESPDQHADRPGQTLATRNHEVIRAWAEERGAVPATVPGTEHDGRPGVLRFDFPNFGGGTLRHVDWDEWFETFDARHLVFLFQETLKNGRQSNFFRLDNPEREDA